MSSKFMEAASWLMLEVGVCSSKYVVYGSLVRKGHQSG